MTTREVLRSLDWLMIGAVFLLVLMNLAMLFSSTYTDDLLSGRFLRQIIAIVIAVILAFIFARLPYHKLRHYVWPIYALGFGGLVVVFLTGHVIRGTTSRLVVAGFQIQPSEFMKIALILTLAWLSARHTRSSWRALVQSALIIGPPIALILLEPDIGVAMLILTLWAGILVFGGLHWSAIFSLGVVGMAGFIGAWHWLFASYQKARIMVFLDPSRDPLGASYNIVQSIVALGSGRLFGRGLGHGPQSQLSFLPERHTDFILASIGEELGFIGIAVIIILYTIILWRILKIARATRDPFGRVLCVGTFLIILVSFMVGAGMNMGILPVTGVPLPMLSYGGSNLVSTFVLLGIVQSVHVYSKWVQKPPTEISEFS
ncbi:MAG: rod shape-determining protein RodA [Candidatus Andersenbacteria bacterium]|nr:rod shape-determining protein RodA [bacterium]MDZ4225714.1 rod shape-determining protein RodA [Candidatus Andersenbacteria bacterium]